MRAGRATTCGQACNNSLKNAWFSGLFFDNPSQERKAEKRGKEGKKKERGGKELNNVPITSSSRHHLAHHSQPPPPPVPLKSPLPIPVPASRPSQPFHLYRMPHRRHQRQNSPSPGVKTRVASAAAAATCQHRKPLRRPTSIPSVSHSRQHCHRHLQGQRFFRPRRLLLQQARHPRRWG